MQIIDYDKNPTVRYVNSEIDTIFVEKEEGVLKVFVNKKEDDSQTTDS